MTNSDIGAPAPALVLFDCDGVLVNSEEIALESEIAMMADIGLTYTPEQYQELYSGLTHERFCSRLRADYAGRMGGDLPEGFLARLSQSYLALEKDALRAPDGLTTLLDRLDAKGIAFGLASNGSIPDIVRKLQLTGTRERFGHNIFSKDMVEHPKPAPDLYLHAMREMGIDNPAQVWVVEDSVTGVKAADAAGMKVIGFVHGRHRPPEHDIHLRRAGARRIARSMQEAGSMILPAGSAGPGRPGTLFQMVLN